MNRIIICFLLFHTISFSQVLNDTTTTKTEVVLNGSINAELSNYQIIATLLEVRINYDDPDYYEELIIVDTLKSDTLSVCDFTKSFCYDINAYQVIDINFDGYKDLLIEISTGLNDEYLIYIFNPDSNQLLFDDELTDLVGFNTEVNTFSKTISTYVDSPPSESESATYKFNNGEWVKIR